MPSDIRNRFRGDLRVFAARAAALAMGGALLGGPVTAVRADSVSSTIDVEWVIASPIGDVISLPDVLSIDSIVVELAHVNGSDLALTVDALDVPGDFDFDLMFADTAGGSPFSMGVIPNNGTLANVAVYTFVARGGGDFTAPHTPSGVMSANSWVTGPLPAQDYVLFLVDLEFIFDGGAIGSWTINYTPVPAPSAMALLVLTGATMRRRRRAFAIGG